VGRERGDLVGIESLEATEAVNQRGIDGSVHKSSRYYTPRSVGFGHAAKALGEQVANRHLASRRETWYHGLVVTTS
jgi:hypothetical protein